MGSGTITTCSGKINTTSSGNIATNWCNPCGTQTYVEIQECQGNAPGGALLKTNLVTLSAGYYFDANKQQNYYYNGTDRSTTSGGSYTLTPVSDCSYSGGYHCVNQAMDLTGIAPYTTCFEYEVYSSTNGAYCQNGTNYNGWDRTNLAVAHVGGDIFTTSPYENDGLPGSPYENNGAQINGCPLFQGTNSGSVQGAQTALWQPSSAGPPYTIYLGVGLLTWGVDPGGVLVKYATAAFVGSFSSSTPLLNGLGGFNLLSASNIPNLLTSGGATYSIPDSSNNTQKVIAVGTGGYANLYPSNMSAAQNVLTSYTVSGGPITQGAHGGTDFGAPALAADSGTGTNWNGVVNQTSLQNCTSVYTSSSATQWGGYYFGGATLSFGTHETGLSGWVLYVQIQCGGIGYGAAYGLFNSQSPVGTYTAFNPYTLPQTLTVS